MTTPGQQEEMMMMAMEEEYEDSRGEIEFSPDNIDGMDTATGTFWYWNEEKQARLVLAKNGVLLAPSNGSMLKKLSQLRAGDPSQGKQ